MIKAPDHVLKVKAYVPGKPMEELERELGIKDPVKLASNENPVGPSPLALEAVFSAAKKGINRYPDGSGFYLKKKLSHILGTDPEGIILGNGSNEIIDIAARTFLRPGDEAIMASPSFVVYSMSVTLQGAAAVEIPLDHNLRHDLPRMAQAVTPRTKMIFIANPNNPTGTINYRQEYDSFFAAIPEDVLVVIDEAYLEYVTNRDYPDSMSCLAGGKNVLILRTFSKIYGLAGLRTGYGISHPEILGQMERVRAPFNSNSLGQAAAIRALDDEDHVKRSREVNEQGKEFLYGELSALGYDYTPTEANFIYIRVSDPLGLFGALLKEGVIIRPAGGDAVRVTIGLPEENKRFIHVLKKTKKPALEKDAGN